MNELYQTDWGQLGTPEGNAAPHFPAVPGDRLGCELVTCSSLQQQLELMEASVWWVFSSQQ